MRLELQHGEFSARVSGWSMRRIRKLAKLAVDMQPVVSEPATAGEAFGFTTNTTIETEIAGED
jgi:hypothetical protein